MCTKLVQVNKILNKNHISDDPVPVKRRIATSVQLQGPGTVYSGHLQAVPTCHLHNRGAFHHGGDYQQAATQENAVQRFVFDWTSEFYAGREHFLIQYKTRWLLTIFSNELYFFLTPHYINQN